LNQNPIFEIGSSTISQQRPRISQSGH
jgi:hypothetical protein